MQTFMSRMGGLLEGLLSLDGHKDDEDRAFESAGFPDQDGQEEDRLPAHDEGWYWAMYSHW